MRQVVHKYKNRILFIIGCISIMLTMVIALVLPKITNKDKKDTITVEEICASLQFYQLDKDEWNQVLVDQIVNPVNYEDMERLVTILGVKEYLDVEQMNEKHTKRTEVTREAYFEIYDQLLSLLDEDRRVKKQEVTVTKRFPVTEEQGVISSENYIFRVPEAFSLYETGKRYIVYTLGMEIIGYQGQGTEVAPQTDYLDAQIRVLLTNKGEKEAVPENVHIQLQGKFALYFKEDKVNELENVTFLISDYMKSQELVNHVNDGNYMYLVPLETNARFTLLYGENSSNPYRGKLYIYPKELTCFMVNDLSVEEYLYGVVPSEMPASYEAEALKAQAVCARSYAYQHLAGSGRLDYYAHVDDTTSYQVYNKSLEQETANQAVDATKGIYLAYQEEIAATYYFSTSMGNTAGASYWGMDGEQYGYLQSASMYTPGSLESEEAFRKFIDTVPTDDYESTCRYYRWSSSVTLNQAVLEEAMLKRQGIAGNVITIYNNIQDATCPATAESFAQLGKLQSLRIDKRDSSGGIRCCAFIYENGEVYLQGEYNIRYCLGTSGNTTTLLSGETIQPTMLPSAFFYIQSVTEGVCQLRGGGYGHGLGMSQNGANGMAKMGYTYEEILLFYYKGVECKQ